MRSDVGRTSPAGAPSLAAGHGQGARAIGARAPFAGTLRVVAALLAYPGAQLHADLADMTRVLRAEDALAGALRAHLEALIASIAASDPLDVEADYVDMFDRGRSTSLHLFEHVHGDSRERGAAMVDLAKTYEAAGLHLAPGELPDYLPAVLEFVSTQPAREARAFLQEIVHILDALHSALHARGSPYASAVAALLALAGEKVRPVPVPAEPPIDEAWNEPEAFGGCAASGQARPGDPQPVRIVRNKVGPGASA